MTALAMHEPRYEIGVLLFSVGMSKARITEPFAVENLIFTLGVTVLAYAVGFAVAPIAADKFLDGVVEIVRSAVAVRMLALAVGLSLPASLFSSLAILRYKPMTNLRNRS